MTIDRKLRRKLNEKVEEAENTNLENETFESFSSILIRANFYLDRNGVGKESEYRERLKKIEGHAKEYFYENKKNNAALNRSYRGNSGYHFIQLNFNFKGFSIRSPLIGTDVKGKSLKWKFNELGRINSLEYMMKHSSLEIHLLDVEKNPERPIDHISTKIRNYKIPDEICKNFKDASEVSIYEDMLRGGYFCVIDLFRNLGKKKIEGAFPERSINLIDVFKDESAMKMLNETVKIFPSVKYNDGLKSLVVSYRPNKDQV